jgi:hypothetical protein
MSDKPDRVTTVTTLASEARSVADEVRLLRRDNRRWLIGLGVLVVVLLVVMVQWRSTAAQSRTILQRVDDCTIRTDSECARKGQARQAEAVRQLNEHADAARVTVGECAVLAHGSVPVYRDCLEKKGVLPPPKP